jgi:hypothetical protein
MGQKPSQSGGGSSQQGIGPVGSTASSSGITAVALMPGSATLPILSS